MHETWDEGNLQQIHQTLFDTFPCISYKPMECANSSHTSPWVFSSLHCGLSSTQAFFRSRKGMLSRPMGWNFPGHEIINNTPGIQLYDLRLRPNRAPSQTRKFHQGLTPYLAINSTLKNWHQSRNITLGSQDKTPLPNCHRPKS